MTDDNEKNTLRLTQDIAGNPQEEQPEATTGKMKYEPLQMKVEMFPDDLDWGGPAADPEGQLLSCPEGD